MSENNKTQSQVQANETEATNEKKEFRIKIAQKIDFDPLFDCKIMESVTLCGLVSKIFHASFSDFEGCNFMVPMTNQNTPNPNMSPSIDLYFNHRETAPTGPDQTRGVTRKLEEQIKSNVVKIVRDRDRRVNEGDKFYLTEDAKNAIAPFLLDIPAIKDRNGNIKWGSIVSLVADPVTPVMGIRTVPSQYTLVKYIDPRKILATVFDDGGKDDPKAYDFTLASRKTANVGYGNQPIYTNNWIMIINRISSQNVKEYMEEYGLGYQYNTTFPMIR